jgi:hypothetical protein
LTGCGGGSSSTSSSNNSACRELARRISGPVLRPGDHGFRATALPNNLRYASILPQGIAKCASATDVAQAILWSQQNDIPLITRSGGHSYAGFSTTHGLMIDSDWLMTMALNWGDYDSRSTVRRNLEWQAGFYEAMRNFSSGAYVNFCDPSLTTWQADYYGANPPRLETIKAQVDPLQVFKFPQSIPPTSTMERRSNLREALYASARRAFARAA